MKVLQETHTCEGWGNPPASVTASGDWDETKHPRVPAGEPGGGRFGPGDGGEGLQVGPIAPTPEGFVSGTSRIDEEHKAQAVQFFDGTVKGLVARAGNDPEARFFTQRLSDAWDRLRPRIGNDGSAARAEYEQRHGPRQGPLTLPGNPFEGALPGDEWGGMANLSQRRDEDEFTKALSDAMVQAYIPEPAGWKPTVTEDEARSIDRGLGFLYHSTDAGAAIRDEGFKLPEYTANLSQLGRGVYWASDAGEFAKFGGQQLKLVSSVPPERMARTYDTYSVPDPRPDGFWLTMGRAAGLNDNMMRALSLIERGAQGLEVGGMGLMYHPHSLSVVQ